MRNICLSMLVASVLIPNSLVAIDNSVASDNKVINKDLKEDINHKDKRVIDLTLKKLINEVIKRNPNIIFDRIQSDMIDSQIRYEDSIFTPTFYLNLTHQDSNTPNNTETTLSKGYLSTYSEVSNNIEMGLTGLLPTGAKWNTSIKSNDRQSNLIEKYKEYDTEYDDSLSLSITQPLMKGFGSDITKSKYYLAKADKDIFDKQFKKKLMDLMGNVIQTYWRYYSANNLKNSWEKSLKISQETIELLETRFKSGDISYGEVLEVKSASMNRKAELKRIESEYVKLQNELFTLLNIKNDEAIDIEFNLVDQPLDDSEDYSDPKEYYKNALVNFPELEIAKEKLKKETMQVKYADDLSDPQLDLVTSASTTTLSDQRENQFYEDDFLTWSVGLQFSLPIFDTQSNSAVQMAKLKKKQVELEIETLDKNLYNAILTKLDSLKNSKDQVTYYKDGLKLKEELYLYTYKAFNLGEKSIRDVLNQEEDIIDYKRKLFNTIIDWKLSQAALDKAVGSLFDKYLKYEDIEKLKDMELNDSLDNDNFGKM